MAFSPLEELRVRKFEYGRNSKKQSQGSKRDIYGILTAPRIQLVKYFFDCWGRKREPTCTLEATQNQSKLEKAFSSQVFDCRSFHFYLQNRSQRLSKCASQPDQKVVVRKQTRHLRNPKSLQNHIRCLISRWQWFFAMLINCRDNKINRHPANSSSN